MGRPPSAFATWRVDPAVPTGDINWSGFRFCFVIEPNLDRDLTVLRTLLLQSLLRDEESSVELRGLREMDRAAFGLAELGFWTRRNAPRRSENLALAAADAPIDPSAHPVDAAVLPCEAAVALSLPVAEMDDAAPEEDLMSKVGRGWIARFGCPHCGRDDVRPWQGWRQASVPLHELPEDIQPADRDAVGRLKEWMRRFHGVATKSLPSYLSSR